VWVTDTKGGINGFIPFIPPKLSCFVPQMVVTDIIGYVYDKLKLYLKIYTMHIK